MPTAPVKITLLVDNQARAAETRWFRHRLRSEHGLSVWIECAGKRILFDTGQGKSLRRNALALGVHLANTDILVVSHGHYDHTGGLPLALRRARHAQVYCHPGVRLPRFAVKDGKARSIGIPKRPLEALDKVPPERLHWVTGPVMLSESIGVTGPIPRATAYEDTGGPFYLDPAGREPDPLEDDLALWIRTDEGVVVCFGCAHSGAINTLDYIRALTEGDTIRAVIGGFHLVNAGPERLEETIAALRPLSIPLIVPCHCTGKEAFRVLAESLGERVSPGAGGMAFHF